MAKIYNSEDITLKVDTMAKKTHYFYKEGRDNPVGELSISRNDELIELISYEKENKELYEKMAGCYNQFINKAPKMHHYNLTAGWLFRDNIYGNKSLLHFPFEIHAVKKDLNSPVIIVNEKQIEELDKNKIPYYSYYDGFAFHDISSSNRNIFFKYRSLDNYIVPTKNESFRNINFNILPRNHQDRIIINFLHGNGNIDQYKELWVPEITFLDKDDNGKIHVKENQNSIEIKEESSMVSLNLSNIKMNKIFLQIYCSKDKLIDSLKTLNDKENKVIFMAPNHASDLGLPYRIPEERGFIAYECNDLINRLKGNNLSLEQ